MSISLMSILPPHKNKSKSPHKGQLKNTYSSLIHSCPKLQIVQISNLWRESLIVTDSYNAVHLGYQQGPTNSWGHEQVSKVQQWVKEARHKRWHAVWCHWNYIKDKAIVIENRSRIAMAKEKGGMTNLVRELVWSGLCLSGVSVSQLSLVVVWWHTCTITRIHIAYTLSDLQKSISNVHELPQGKGTDRLRELGRGGGLGSRREPLYLQLLHLQIQLTGKYQRKINNNATIKNNTTNFHLAPWQHLYGISYRIRYCKSRGDLRSTGR